MTPKDDADDLLAGLDAAGEAGEGAGLRQGAAAADSRRGEVRRLLEALTPRRRIDILCATEALTAEDFAALRAECRVPTYGIELWDHDALDDGTFEGEWSVRLAREVLGGPAEGLTARQCVTARRALFALGWSPCSVYVSREGP